MREVVMKNARANYTLARGALEYALAQCFS